MGKNVKVNEFILFAILFCMLMIPDCFWGIEKEQYVCNYASEKITIDGNLDEPDWQKAKVLNFSIPATFETPISKTEGKVLWDENYLYVSFKASDKDIIGKCTTRDLATYKDDVDEIFIKPNLQNDTYYNFEVNVLGTIYDALNPKGENYKEVWEWNCDDVKIGIKIEGTLNNSSDEDKYWQMEVAIPFSQLPTLKEKSPKSGDIWAFHLARYDWSIYLPLGKELSSCAPLTKINFHYHQDWIELQFKKQQN